MRYTLTTLALLALALGGCVEEEESDPSQSDVPNDEGFVVARRGSEEGWSEARRHSERPPNGEAPAMADGGAGGASGGGSGGRQRGEWDAAAPFPDAAAAAMGGTGGASGMGGAAGSGAARPDDRGSPDGPATIAEADIIKVDGDRLYALSGTQGLAVIDIADPRELRILGRATVEGQPFEMYVDDQRVLALYRGVRNQQEGLSSHLLVIDAEHPQEMTLDSTHSLAGTVRDSRRVGDHLYILSEVGGLTVLESLTATGDVARVGRLALPLAPGSIYVTSDRIYLLSASRGPASIVKVIDISAHDGSMHPGAEFELGGQAGSRWHASERGGVLRVASQQGRNAPVVETFAVRSADEVTRLASLQLRLPRPEQLMSVRFDGDRAYVVTFPFFEPEPEERPVDPLFTVDLSDPEHPVQRGEIEIPGWLHHMVPMGDRLVAVGLADEWTGEMAMSLFDVSDLDQPRMIDREQFGTDMTGDVADQDRVHKAFTVLADEGLILAPFLDTRCGSSRSGIQIFEFGEDLLEARGIVRHFGEARRAFLRDEHLFVISDAGVEADSIADLDHPARLSHVALHEIDVRVDRLVAFGAHLLSLEGEAGGPVAWLRVLSGDDPSARPAPELGLEALTPPGVCGGLAGAEVVRDGDRAWVTWNFEGALHLAAVDMATPWAPRLLGHEIVDLDDAHLRRAPGLPGEAGIVVNGALVFKGTDASLYVVDVSQGGRPGVAQRVLAPEGARCYTRILKSETAAWLACRRLTAEGRWWPFIWGVDLSDPAAPVERAPINTPGLPVHLDGDRLISHGAMCDGDDCDTAETLVLSRLSDGQIEILDRVEVGEIASVAATSSHVFVLADEVLAVPISDRFGEGLWARRPNDALFISKAHGNVVVLGRDDGLQIMQAGQTLSLLAERWGARGVEIGPDAAFIWDEAGVNRVPLP